MRSEIEALKGVISLQETSTPRQQQQLIKLKSTASSSSSSSSIGSGLVKPPIRKAPTESIKSMTTSKLNEKFAKKTKMEMMRRRGSRYFVDDDKFTNKIDDKKDNESSSSSSSIAFTVMSEGI